MWELIESIGDRFYWRRVDNGDIDPIYIYNVTNDPKTPPSTDGGYYKLNTIKRLKGDIR